MAQIWPFLAMIRAIPATISTALYFDFACPRSLTTPLPPVNSNNFGEPTPSSLLKVETINKLTIS